MDLDMVILVSISAFIMIASSAVIAIVNYRRGAVQIQEPEPEPEQPEPRVQPQQKEPRDWVTANPISTL